MDAPDAGTPSATSGQILRQAEAGGNLATSACPVQPRVPGSATGPFGGYKSFSALAFVAFAS